VEKGGEAGLLELPADVGVGRAPVLLRGNLGADEAGRGGEVEARLALTVEHGLGDQHQRLAGRDRRQRCRSTGQEWRSGHDREPAPEPLLAFLDQGQAAAADGGGEAGQHHARAVLAVGQRDDADGVAAPRQDGAGCEQHLRRLAAIANVTDQNGVEIVGLPEHGLPGIAGACPRPQRTGVERTG
jgi:hypothetical protein